MEFFLDTNQVVIQKFFLLTYYNKIRYPVLLELIKTDAQGNYVFIVILLERHSDLFPNHVQVEHSQGVNVLKTDGVVVLDSKNYRVLGWGLIEL